MSFESDLSSSGYSTFQALSISELDLVRSVILNDINRLFASHGIIYSNWNEFLLNYHLHSSALHSLLSSKGVRLFRGDSLDHILSLSLHKLLLNHFGSFVITDEEHYGFPEIYWRLVRPDSPSDVGPFHADSWFWSINKDWSFPSSCTKRFKVWISIQSEPGLNGLLVVPGSHASKSFTYGSNESNGKLKPSSSSNLILIKFI